MTWKRRLSILLSLIWLILVYAIASSSYDTKQMIVVVGLLPLVIIWGVWWVITGGKRGSSPLQNTNEFSKPNEQDNPATKIEEKKKKSGWLSQTLGTAVFLAVFVFAKEFTQKQVATHKIATAIGNGTLASELGIDKKSPLEFIRTSQSDLEGFKRGMRSTFEAVYNTGGSTIKVINISTSDLVTNFLVSTAFEGSMIFDGVEGVHLVKGDNRRYYHSNGMLQLEGICLTEKSNCDTLPLLMSQSQTKVISKLNEIGVGGVLPSRDKAQCEIVPQTQSQFGKEIHFDNAICVFQEGIILSFTRFTDEQVRAMINAMSTNEKGKELLRANFDESN